jgi:hypothetical protein
MGKEPKKPIEMVEVEGVYISERRKVGRGALTTATQPAAEAAADGSIPGTDTPNRRQKRANATANKRRRMDRYAQDRSDPKRPGGRVNNKA